jgi:glutathione S-transferase
VRRDEDGAHERLDAELAKLNAILDAQSYLTGREFGLADIAYVPWILRARDRMGVELGGFGALAEWLERLSERSAIAAELDVVAAL